MGNYFQLIMCARSKLFKQWAQALLCFHSGYNNETKKEWEEDGKEM